MVKTIEPRIKVEKVPNPEVRCYHLTTEISKYSIHSFSRPIKDGGLSDGDFKEVGKFGTALLHKVFAIPGVSEVFIEPYKLSVTKGGAFEWDEIEPDLLDALKECFRGARQKVKITRFASHHTSPFEEFGDMHFSSNEDEA